MRRPPAQPAENAAALLVSPAIAFIIGVTIFPDRLMRWLTVVLPVFLFAVPFACAADAKSGDADETIASRVLILANSGDPDSLRVAKHYASARRVPVANIVALPMSANEAIAWREFVSSIWEPLMAQLVREGWIDAIAMDIHDGVGRRKYAVNHHRIAALVVCRGVPLKIVHDPLLYTEALPYTTHGEFRTNAGAVDAELSLLPSPNYPINAFVPNPLFRNERPTAFEQEQVVKVSRLDGPSVDDALALVDHALDAEREGLLGRAYVDLSDRDEVGNGWLEATASQLKALNFDTEVDREPALIPATARFDAPVLYFGWYAGNIGGPFTLPGFRFPPGAIALHIHSYSAATLRSTTSGWTGPFVARGVTATVGNVNEPYLDWTHRPNLLLRSLSRGSRLVDAAYFALEALSWQEVLIGDPLYRPFAVTLDRQLENLASLPPQLAPYAVLRQAHQLETAGRPTDALTLLQHVQRDQPSLPVGVLLARKLRDAGDSAGAASALAFAADLKSFETDQWALAREAAQLLAMAGRPARALEIWRALLASKNLPVDLRITWLREAAQAASGAGDVTQAEAWRTEADGLTVPPASL